MYVHTCHHLWRTSTGANIYFGLFSMHSFTNSNTLTLSYLPKVRVQLFWEGHKNLRNLLKKIRSKIIQITPIDLWSFIPFELRHLNSKKMSQKAKFGCSIFQLKIKRKQIFQVRHQFGHFIKCRIWHEKHIDFWKKWAWKIELS